MLNHTYTSVKNANLVDCGKKQHIPSQPSPLLKDNFLGEFRTELDKKKVLANLGIATTLSLEWEYIKGDIGRSTALMQELDSRTKYVSEIDGFQKTLSEGIKYLESVIGGEQDVETEQNERITKLEEASVLLNNSLTDLQTYLTSTIEVDLNKVKEDLEAITSKVNNITDDDVAGAPTLKEVMPDFFKFCDGCVLVSYVIDFDFGFIDYHGKSLGYAFQNKTDDAFVLAKSKLKGLHNYKLVTVAKHLGVSLENAHRAVFDAVATGEVMVKLLENF